MVCACKRVYISAEFKNLCIRIDRLNPVGNCFPHYYLIYVTSMLVCMQPCALVYTSTETNAQIVCLFFSLYFILLSNICFRWRYWIMSLELCMEESFRKRSWLISEHSASKPGFCFLLFSCCGGE